MKFEEIRDYCISKPDVTESFPFNDTALVFKVAGKMFALLDLSEDSRGLTLKCDPELTLELRERFPDVTPAYHFNKQYWNTVQLNGSVPEKLIREWIVDSYNLVVAKLPRKQRQELENRGSW